MFPANYTIRLCDLVDNEQFKEILNTYPIYDENYRETLNQNIINHYMFDEIGLETPALFNHYLKTRLNEIMPKYNMLYESNLLKLDPLSNYSIIEKLNKKNDVTSNDVKTLTEELSTEISNNDEVTSNSTSDSSTTNNNTTNENLSSNSTKTDSSNKITQYTPQGKLVHENINNFSYANNHEFGEDIITDSSSNENNVTSNNTGTNKSTNELSTINNGHTLNNANNKSSQSNNIKSSELEDYVKNITGNKNISLTNLYNEFINNFTYIDTCIINDLSDLFMGIF